MPSDLERDDIEMEGQVEESVAPARGRGRPKKYISKSKAEEKSSDEPPVKRGRGRPAGGTAKAEKAPKAKKIDEDLGDGEVEQDADKAPAKRRRRPTKAAAKEKEPEPEPEEDNGDIEDDEPVPPPPAKSKGAKRVRKVTKNGHANGDAKEDEAVEEEKSDNTTSDSRIKIVVEHCKSCHTYRRKAEDIITALKEKWSNIEVEYNPKPPRKGSFEINLIDNNGSDVKLWTGLELGPPRKLKFPEPEKVVEAMEKAYVPESA